MGKKFKREKKSFLKTEHEEDEEREAEVILQSKMEEEMENQNENSESDAEAEDESQELSIPSINITEDIEEKLNLIQEDVNRFYTNKNKTLTPQQKWLEFPVSVSTLSIPQELNPDDDIKRELIFFNIAKENAINSMIKLKSLGEKLNRPDDYFVEMLKSDDQMAKVKREIISEEMRIKKSEIKKQKLQNIKFAKVMKDFQNKEKSSLKKQTLQGVENWKKHIKNNPNDYKDIDKFMGDGKKKKFNPKEFRSNKPFSKKEERWYKKQNQIMKNFGKGKGGKRPGKVKRMMMRNKKNSKKNK